MRFPRAVISTAAVGVALGGLSACTSPTSPKLKPPQTTSPPGSPSSSSSAKPPSLGQPPDPTGALPPTSGTLLISRSGTGSATFALPPAAVGHTKTTIRLSCVGSGSARLSDAKHNLIMEEGGCTPYAVYSAGPFTTTAARRSITLTINPASHWRIAIYQTKGA